MSAVRFLSLGTLLSTCILTFSVLAGATAHADTFVTPLAETGGLNTAFRNAPRVYQSYLSSSTMSGLTAGTPVLITGIQLRLAATGNGVNSASWPSQTLNFADYTIELSQASAQLRTAGEYLSNTASFSFGQGAGLTTVRSGALSLDTGSFVNSGPPRPFGQVIAFTTPYTFNPGDDLVYTIRHTGYTPNNEPSAFFANATAANGVADAIASTASASATNASAGTNPYVVQFVFASAAVVPEASTFALALPALGMVGAVVLRRRKK